ncbi:ribulose 1,5-bisphosphate synthetase/thiazole synthase [Nakamurella sp. UYEF19]|uniref:FAD-dependent oxidoreductase n=1 Tax=Nakamurella sp. UYEF19 TaxID=1756392 RepID=UPI00339A5351
MNRHHFPLAGTLGGALFSIPEIASVDVLVVGGGSAGCTAAIAAARGGADVLLLEKSGRLGGIGTAVLDTFYGFYTPGENRKVVGGIGDEVVDALTSVGAAFIRPNTYGAGGGVTYNPEVLLTVWDGLVTAAKVPVLFHSVVIDVIKGDRPDQITGVLVANKNGLSRVSARYVVDSSGDADVCAFGGAGFDGAETGEQVQALTTTFRLANVDTERSRSFPKEELFARMAEGAASGAYDLPRQEGSIHRTPVDGVSLANMTRVENIDPTDVQALSRAEMEGRRQVGEYVRFLREKIPGYEAAELVGVGMHIGVRESRRIHGEYQLTADDVLSARRFDDSIASCGAPIEDHTGGTDTVWKYIPDSGTYDIPYRVLLPRALSNVIVAGRCLSATHEAHASCRSIAQCLAMGQAAGTAVAQALPGDLALRDVDVPALQHQLLADGVILENPSLVLSLR